MESIYILKTILITSIFTLRPDMTEKLLTGTLSLNTTNQNLSLHYPLILLPHI